MSGFFVRDNHFSSLTCNLLLCRRLTLLMLIDRSSLVYTVKSFKLIPLSILIALLAHLIKEVATWGPK